MSDVNEAKVDKGRSDYGKASIRNYRRKGPGHGDPGMFDPSGKRGKTIDLRRKEHEARRGKKGAKVPAYKVEHHQKDKDGNTIPHEGDELEEAKKGLYANIHAKRKRGEAPAKPGHEDYPAKDAFKKAAKTAKKEEVELTEKKLDPVGKEDKDIDNDGDHDKSDKYLIARRKKVGKILAMKKKK